MVDYCGYPFFCHARDGDDSENRFFEVVRPFVCRDGEDEYGLKKWSV